MNEIVKLKNIANAFVYLDFGGIKFAIDPWVESGLYDGGWSLFPQKTIDKSFIDQITHLYITHLHEDHCDGVALNMLNKNVEAFIPNVFGSYVLERKLRNAGIANIHYLDVGVKVKICNELEAEVIPPMNRFGQDYDLYKKIEFQSTSTAIDTGIMLDFNGLKLIFLADNSPYDIGVLGNALKRMKDADLLAFPYNGAASDYPICYKNITNAEMIEIADKRELNRENSTKSFINLIKPKLLMPYSSDFAVIGPAAMRFAEFSNQWWANKKQVSKRYEESLGIRSVALDNSDLLIFGHDDLSNSRIKLIQDQKEEVSLREFELNLYSNTCFVDEKYKPLNNDLNELTTKAANHMFQYMDKIGIKSEWIFQVIFKDSIKKYSIDLDKRCVNEITDLNVLGRNVLRVTLGCGYYEALLLGDAHWNNAQLSFQLEWERFPNKFNNALYTAINFLHISKSERSTYK